MTADPQPVRLAAVSWGPGRIDLFWTDDSLAVWHRAWIRGAWADAESLGGAAAGGIPVTACAVDATALLPVFADGHPWDRYWDGRGWHDWESLGGALTGPPAATSAGADRIDVLSPGRDGRTWHRWWDGARWVEWETLPD